MSAKAKPIPARSCVDVPQIYNGLDVRHPRMVEAAKTMIKLGKNSEDICRTLGMAQEVLARIRRDMKT